MAATARVHSGGEGAAHRLALSDHGNLVAHTSTGMSTHTHTPKHTPACPRARTPQNKQEEKKENSGGIKTKDGKKKEEGGREGNRAVVPGTCTGVMPGRNVSS